MSVAKGIPSVVHVINSFVDISGFAVKAPKTCLIARIFIVMFLWLCASSAHALVINLCMQTSYVASGVVQAL